MQAFVLSGFDQPANLASIDRPEPLANEVLIRVRATSVNPVDSLVAGGFFRTVQEYRFPAVFGRDLCGVVEAVGSEVTRFSPGTTVWGFIKREYIGDGTFAEYVTSPEDYFIAAKPPGIGVLEASVLGLSSITALECLDALRLRAGDTVLITGATGGVGSYAVQIAASRGLRVIATARPGEASGYARALGAHEVVDWTREQLAADLRVLVPDGVDGLVDLVRRDTSAVIGSDESASRRQLAELALAVLRRGGRLSSVTNGCEAALLGDLVGTNVHSSPSPENLARINELVRAGAVRSPIAARYDLDRIEDAFARQAAGALGKVAVAIDPELLAS